MTRKDAIKTLKELWRETNDPWYEEVYNMAINALEEDRKGSGNTRAIVELRNVINVAGALKSVLIGTTALTAAQE